MAHVRYLTGFSGSSGLCVITPTKQFFVTDRRYETQASQEVDNFNLIIAKHELIPFLAEKKLIPRLARTGFEERSISVAEMKMLRNLFSGRRFVPAARIFETITAVKDDGEVACIRHAAQITDKVFRKIVSLVKQGVRECDIAAEISYWHRKYGAESDAFDPIVAGGERGALPHARATENKIMQGDMVVMDFGCRYCGYHSDLTRTIAVGRPSAEMKKVFQIVYDAQRKAMDAVRSGVSTRSIDAIARTHIRHKGYGRYFYPFAWPRFGHSIHEALRLSRSAHRSFKPEMS